MLAEGDDVAGLVAVAVGGLLASPVSWTHHWLWALPGTLVLASRGRSRWAVGLGVLFWLGPMWFLVPGELRELDFGPAQRVVSLAYVLAGLVWLAVASRPAVPSGDVATRGGAPGEEEGQTLRARPDGHHDVPPPLPAQVLVGSQPSPP